MEGCISGLNSKSHSNERTLRRIFQVEFSASNFTGRGIFSLNETVWRDFDASTVDSLYLG